MTQEIVHVYTHYTYMAYKYFIHIQQYHHFTTPAKCGVDACPSTATS